MVPVGTPREIIQKLHDDIQQRVVKSSSREPLIKDGYEVTGLSPEAFSVCMKRQMSMWANVGHGHQDCARKDGMMSLEIL